MTREQQLQFCKKCENRKMDVQQGLLCGLTGEKATFEQECPDFVRDESVEDVPMATEEALTAEEVTQRLPTDLVEKLRVEQNLPLGVGAGLAVGLIGAVLWGAITVATEFQIGYMAVAIGAGVGYAIRIFGKGIDEIFGYCGAVIALVSCLLGNFLSIIGFVANAEGLTYLETLAMVDYSLIPEIMMATFNIIDLLFYGIALYEGYKCSFRRHSVVEINTLGAN